MPVQSKENQAEYRQLSAIRNQYCSLVRHILHHSNLSISLGVRILSDIFITRIGERTIAPLLGKQLVHI